MHLKSKQAWILSEKSSVVNAGFDLYMKMNSINTKITSIKILKGLLFSVDPSVPISNIIALFFTFFFMKAFLNPSI